ncbi:MAG TPA: glycosyltransferase family 1 protein [Alphaproteobacteria bacterium]|nr:glycosyltransferase family 1 protein [Alphaproteobacteria bacterium]
MASNDKTAKNTPIRVLHIAFTMHARGTETWLMNVLRRMDRRRIAMDFVTIVDEVGIYDDEIKALGGTLHACPHPQNRGAFLRAFREVLEKHGPYDIVHAHPYTMSGLILLQAARAGVPVRIVHSHTDRRKARRDKSIFKRIYAATMRRLIKRVATYGIAASKQAAEALFGPKWQNDKRWNVMYCGIDLKPFEKPPESDIRQKLGIAASAKIIGHVGSFHFEKNHDFLIRLFAEMAKKDLKLILLLVGDGPLRDKIQQDVIKLGLEDRVVFVGVTQHIPEFLSIMDVFLFPSLFEGLGLSLIEAQAAGLRCLASDAVPREAAVNGDLVTFMELGDDIDAWAKATKILLEQNKPDRQKSLEIVKKSEFNIDHNVTMLCSLYETLCGHTRQGKA